VRILLLLLLGCSQVEIAKTPQIVPVKPNDVFYTKSNLQFIKDSVACANLISKNSLFKQEVLSRSYEQTTDSPEQVWDKISKAPFIEVKPIYPKNVFTKMTATTFANDLSIYLNARKTRSKALWVGSIFHEMGHRLGYKHNRNSAKGNEKSQPYQLGDIGEKLAYLCK
jgi:predicted Zn-dependent protease